MCWGRVSGPRRPACGREGWSLKKNPRAESVHPARGRDYGRRNWKRRDRGKRGQWELGIETWEGVWRTWS